MKTKARLLMTLTLAAPLLLAQAQPLQTKTTDDPPVLSPEEMVVSADANQTIPVPVKPGAGIMHDHRSDSGPEISMEVKREWDSRVKRFGAGQQPKALSEAPIAQWHGEGNGLDSVGGNNAFALKGVEFAKGISGQAFKFNGDGASVDILRSPALDLRDQVTVEFWMKADADNAMATYQGLVTSEFYGVSIANGYSAGMGVIFFIGADGGAQMAPPLWLNTADANGGGAPVSPGQWHHIAGTYDGTKLQLYVDGRPQGRPNYHTGPMPPMERGNFVSIGSEQGRTLEPQITRTRYFQGLIDEVAIYNRALSAEEIAAIHRAKGAAPSKNLPAGLVSWWLAEGNAMDSADHTNGVLKNGVGFAPGVAGQAFVFDGDSENYVEVPDSPTLRLTDALTLSCWAKRLNTSEIHTLVEKGGAWTGGQTDYEITLNDTYLGGKHFGFAFAGGWRGCAVTPDKEWHHYAAVAVSGEADPILYIDGEPQAVTLRGGSPIVKLTASERPLHIGAMLDPQGGWFYYSSTLIDAPALFNRALSASEIQVIAKTGKAGPFPLVASRPPNKPEGLVSWWPAEGNAMDSADHNNGVLKGGVGFAPGIVGQAFAFNGTSSYVRVPNSADLNPTGSFSIEAWVYPRQNPPEGAVLVTKWGDRGELEGQRSFTFSLLPGRALSFGISDSAHQWDGEFHAFATDPEVVTEQAWNHVVAVYDQSSGTRRIFVNGVQVKSRTDEPITICNGRAPITIGAHSRGGGEVLGYFHGLIDEVSLYHRALSAEEIQAAYSAIKSGKPKPEQSPKLASRPPTTPAGLVSWWRAEGNGLDVTGRNNGVLKNGVEFAPGVLGQAFVFDTDRQDHVEVPDSPTLRLTDALTISCWAKRLNTSEVHNLLEKGGDWTGGHTDYEIGLNDTYPGGSHFGFSFAGGWRGCAVTPDKQWHHYAAVAVSGEEDPILYIDGEPQEITFRGGPPTMRLSASERPLHIGAQLDPQAGWFYYSSTMIDAPALFNRALSASEIQVMVKAGKASKPGLFP
ncbi:MAG: hypothetical protein NT154_15865 [Verrucomicrobia bacterium]|nr:hypothetical protein [Verrucomicrobiota bacterium]